MVVVIFFEQRRRWRRKKLLRNRPQLSALDFCVKFYQDYEQAVIAARVREVLTKNLETSLDGLLPTDRLDEDLMVELPVNPDLFWDLEAEFGIKTDIDLEDNCEQLQQALEKLVTVYDLVCYVEGKLKTAQKP
jgi:acyl carrier protein